MTYSKISNDIKTILMDIGRVLVSVDFNRFITKCIKRSNKSRKEIERYLTNSKLIKDYGLGKVKTKDFLKRFKSELSYKGNLSDLKKIWGDIFIPINQNINLIKKISPKYQLIAISNTNPLHAQIISKMNIYKLFNKTILSYKVSFSKPDPAIFKEALKKANSNINECIYIDDQEENIMAAKKLGLKSKQIKKPSQLKNILDSFGIDIPSS